MIKKIKLAINNKIKTEFSSIEIVSNDEKDGITRPSFDVDFSYDKSINIAAEITQRDLTVKIYYFASNKYKKSIEQLDVRERLREIFFNKKLKVEDMQIPINEFEIDTIDGVLQTSFDLSINLSNKDIDDNELMGELEVNMKEE